MQIDRPDRQKTRLLEPDPKEIWRYCGYGINVPDEDELSRIENTKEKLLDAVEPCCVWECCDLLFGEDDLLSFGGLSVRSRSLSKVLQGCSAVIMLASTLGLAPDRMIARAKITSLDTALRVQAVSAALLEAYLDRFTEELRALPSFSGTVFRPRFSPGYGDLPLTLQKELLPRLRAQQTVGITLNDSLLMMPSKSVTALIGVKRCLTDTEIS